MKQNSSELIRLLARLEDVLTDGQFVLDGLSVSKVISRRNVDGFLTKFPHERDWFLYFGNVSWDKFNKCRDKLFVNEICLRIYTKLYV